MKYPWCPGHSGEQGSSCAGQRAGGGQAASGPDAGQRQTRRGGRAEGSQVRLPPVSKCWLKLKLSGWLPGWVLCEGSVSRLPARWFDGVACRYQEAAEKNTRLQESAAAARQAAMQADLSAARAAQAANRVTAAATQVHRAAVTAFGPAGCAQGDAVQAAFEQREHARVQQSLQDSVLAQHLEVRHVSVPCPALLHFVCKCVLLAHHHNSPSNKDCQAAVHADNGLDAGRCQAQGQPGTCTALARAGAVA